MDRKMFEALVQDAVRDLPNEFRTKLSNVAIIVEDSPSKELLDRMGIPPEGTLFGFYEGVPLTSRGFESPLHPDRILIFQGPIEEACDSPDEIREEVRITLVHEIAHFFGIDDDALEELGYD